MSNLNKEEILDLCKQIDNQEEYVRVSYVIPVEFYLEKLVDEMTNREIEVLPKEKVLNYLEHNHDYANNCLGLEICNEAEYYAFETVHEVRNTEM
ncbi:hypothetical protein [Thermoactinomyces sp. DSM 45892]|uniref:hypothetical protein n=1 Tax=Thermoactinomyces sp. DSM 45892 TaxID=1882753 RepID=UPI00089A5893|nr:hypothetical protein [Thermoactinomyces sp. DSM 45892]SDY88949.1 hypothetical protein SAMN05444416_109181 [Thermoactinomyces sp. DSM 45892]